MRNLVIAIAILSVFICLYLVAYQNS